MKLTKKITISFVNFLKQNDLLVIFAISLLLSLVATYWSYSNNFIIAYGDSESHLNISKRVVHSLTPGAAQLGGIWLPLPHLLMVPFVYFDSLWQTGLAGSIVSGISFIVATIFIYKTSFLLTKSRLTSVIGSLVFAFNPNILYMQTAPMTELPLIAFFILAIYYFLIFLKNNNKITALITSAFFVFCATLSRYDGWLLALAILGGIILNYIFRKKVNFSEFEGKLVLFSTLAFFGIALWLLWDFLILGDPLYFTNSAFSAKSQQQGWLAQGQLPAYKNLGLSVMYYAVTTYENTGIIMLLLAMLGLLIWLIKEKGLQNKLILPTLITVPFFFYVVTMYMGQSIIFIPQLTPSTFEWDLFNVRYGLMMLPFTAIFVAYLWKRSFKIFKVFILLLTLAQLYIFYNPQANMPITLADGVVGLSASSHPNAEQWLANNYDHGLVLLDDYARTLSIIGAKLPMQNTIYVGNKPYWQESLKKPQKYSRWVVMQKDDTVWKTIYENKGNQGNLFKHYRKVYTSPEILIFKINDNIAKN
jgi:hypothetical protein